MMSGPGEHRRPPDQHSPLLSEARGMTEAISLDHTGYLDCVEELIAFRNANRAIARDRHYFDWRYAQRPCTRGAFVVWAKLGNVPVGAISVFPHDYFVLDAEYPVGVIGDVSVSSELRGRGVAVAMIEHLNCALAEHGLVGGLVLPTATAARSFAKGGWLDAGRIERRAKQLHFGALMQRITGPGIAARLLAAPLDLVTGMLSWDPLGDTRCWQVDECADFDERFDHLWAAAPKRGRMLGVRTSAYLRWRFAAHPTTEYRVLTAVLSGTLRAYAVFHIDARTCHVDDLFFDDEGIRTAIVRMLIRHLRQQRECDKLSIGTTDWGWATAWRLLGFIRRPDFQQVMTWKLDLAADHLSKYLTPADKDV